MTDPSLPPTGQKNLEAFQALLEIDEKERSFKKRQGYITAYVLSLLVPPVGIFFCIKYIFFSDGTPDDMRAGLISLGLTGVAIVLLMALTGMLFGSTTMQNSSQNLDTLKQLLTPANQKQFKDLVQ